MERKFVVGDLVIYKEFKYPNTSKLTPIFCGLYRFLSKLYDVNYKIDRQNYHAETNTEIVPFSKLCRYNYSRTKIILN